VRRSVLGEHGLLDAVGIARCIGRLPGGGRRVLLSLIGGLNLARLRRLTREA